MQFDFDVISKALQTLLEATLPILAGMAALWLRAKYDIMREQLTAEKRYALDKTIDVAIYAAEQLDVTGVINDKLEFVTELVEARAAELGLKLSVAEIRAMIESAVKQNFNAGSSQPLG